jgi:hypothetical protein
MNCNAKTSSANIFPRATHYISNSRMWLASRGLATPAIAKCRKICLPVSFQVSMAAVVEMMVAF